MVDANDVPPPESVPVELTDTWAPGAVVPETVVEPDTAWFDVGVSMVTGTAVGGGLAT